MKKIVCCALCAFTLLAIACKSPLFSVVLACDIAFAMRHAVR